jgi:acylphosphatase
VQGVCFRSFTADKAEGLKLTGHVKNESDGSVFFPNATICRNRSPLTYFQVTGEAQGDKDSLNQFVQHLHKGPPAARVSNVEQSDIATKEGEKGFSE